MILSALYSTNILTTNYCLLYISYPVQVIGRNIRFLFVVLIGSFFSRLKNTSHGHLKLGKHKMFMAIVITIGVLLYNFAKGVCHAIFRKNQIRQIDMILSFNGLDIHCYLFPSFVMPFSLILKPTIKDNTNLQLINYLLSLISAPSS